jgi:midasin (ATPase involved in ribosome maturation)
MILTEKLCCVKAKKTPIIQGVIASGKSFIIKLLAEILGQDLSIYQLNSNSGISLFTGQSITKEEFYKKEKAKSKEILKLLK